MSQFLRSFVTVVACVVVASACGAIPVPGKKCNVSNFTGCCDANDACQDGTKADACGLGAKACVACGAGTGGGSGGASGGASGGGSGGGSGGAIGGGTGGATGGGSGGAVGGGTAGAVGGGTGGAVGGGSGGAVGGGTGGSTAVWNTSGLTGQVWISGDIVTPGTNVYTRDVLPSTNAVVISTPARKVGSATTSADGLVVVMEYTSTATVVGELVYSAPDGTSPISLGAIPAGQYVYGLAISPNDQWVVFSRGNAGTTQGLDLFAQRLLAGSTPVQISPARPGGLVTLQPTRWLWSNDSRYVALTGDFGVLAARVCEPRVPRSVS